MRSSAFDGFGAPAISAIRRRSVNAAEATGDRRRAFAMASTTEEDTPHDGAPTSWSSEVDQLTAGVSGIKKTQRLMVISAGNTVQNMFGNADYLAVCDHPDNEIESPAQAWNAICVGAYTEKTVLPAGEPGTPLAQWAILHRPLEPQAGPHIGR